MDTIYTSVNKEVGLKLTPFRRTSIYEKRRGLFSLDNYQLGLATLVFDYKAVLIGTYQDVEEMAEQNLSTVVSGVMGTETAELMAVRQPGQGYTSVAGFGGGDAGADAGADAGGDADTKDKLTQDKAKMGNKTEETSN
ncbi:hypothetical protein Bbelb_390580 [Branchiostoma belcheri]|nr:hypothetical protein Bbelb_413020 [Branchiostoma belcheri]KAI8483176.1 hypothetical protein Bbelb_390580 [Branchiostoma belcheri]